MMMGQQVLMGGTANGFRAGDDKKNTVGGIGQQGYAGGYNKPMDDAQFNGGPAKRVTA